MFEHFTHPLLPRVKFLLRVARGVAAGLALIAISLLAGMAGYHHYEGLAWLDAFLNSAMLLSGMGPLWAPVTRGGKLFAGIFALYSGLAVVLVAGLTFAPFVHRALHRFHLEEGESDPG